MVAPEPLMEMIERRTAAGDAIRVRTRKELLALGWLVASLGADFLLLLINSKFSLLAAWKLPRGTTGPQGFPTDAALRLALRAGAAGMFIIQNRDSDDLTPRRADLALTHSMRRALAETGIDLVDHLLISGGCMCTAGGLSAGPEKRVSPFTGAM